MKYRICSLSIFISLSVLFAGNSHANERLLDVLPLETKQEIRFLVSQCINYVLERGPVDENQFDTRGYIDTKFLFGNRTKKVRFFRKAKWRGDNIRIRSSEFLPSKPNKPKRSCDFSIGNGLSFHYNNPFVFNVFEENGFIPVKIRYQFAKFRFESEETEFIVGSSFGNGLFTYRLIRGKKIK
ncbi:MAG: hypothetical protein AAGE61_15365 [Pseudomonadota bacterium]